MSNVQPRGTFPSKVVTVTYLRIDTFGLGVHTLKEKFFLKGMDARKKSLVWNHFTTVERGKAKCGFCENVLSYTGGSTTNLARHIRLKHPTVGLRLGGTPTTSERQDEAADEHIVIEEGAIMEIYNLSLNKVDGDSSKTSSSEEKILLQPFDHLLQVPGKKIRSKLTKAFNYWLDIPSDKRTAVGEIVEMLHNASLLIDDIEDSSLLRRGIPVAHHIFGIPTTINSANYVYFLSLQKVLELGHSEATKIFTDHLLELHRGQGMEIYWRDNFVCPSEAEYRQMVMRKTGGLIGLAVGLMQLFSENKSDFTNLIGIIGLYFQFRDDYANLQSKDYTENKSYCEDLTEGKFSFPIIHAIRHHSESPQIFNIIRQRTTSVEIKKYAVDLLEKLGSFEYTRTCLLELDQKAREEINFLGENPHMVSVLDELKNW